MKFNYFAYGSNMLTTRLKARCASAKLIGRVEAHGYALDFSKLSRDESGKGTLRSSDEDGVRATGVLFEIDMDERGILDKEEGLGNGYDRDNAFAVRHVGSGEIIHATTYLATENNDDLKPYDWYLASVIAGAHEHDLGDGFISWLRAIEFQVDSNEDRKTRKKAIKAIIDYGVPEYKTLLGQ